MSLDVSAIALLHSPLLGPASWGDLPSVLPDFRLRPIVVNVENDCQPPYALSYCASAAAQISAELVRQGEPEWAILGFSGAGPLVPAVCAELPRSQLPNNIIYCDANLPAPGSTRLDLMEAQDGTFLRNLRKTLEDGASYPTWTYEMISQAFQDEDQVRLALENARPRTLEFFIEPLPSGPALSGVDCAYLQMDGDYSTQARVARSLGWDVARIDGSHFSALTDPRRVAKAILALLERAGRSRASNEPSP